MSNCNPFKVSLKYSYPDLANLPRINGVEILGDLSLEDLGIDDWLNDISNTFIKNSSDGSVNTNGFTIQETDETEEWSVSAAPNLIEAVFKVSGYDFYSVAISSDSIGLYDHLYDQVTEILPNSITLSDGSSSAVLDAVTVEALISLL
jgi:hypothetical protein